MEVVAAVKHNTLSMVLGISLSLVGGNVACELSLSGIIEKLLVGLGLLRSVIHCSANFLALRQLNELTQTFSDSCRFKIDFCKKYAAP